MPSPPLLRRRKQEISWPYFGDRLLNLEIISFLDVSFSVDNFEV